MICKFPTKLNKAHPDRNTSVKYDQDIKQAKNRIIDSHQEPLCRYMKRATSRPVFSTKQTPNHDANNQ